MRKPVVMVKVIFTLFTLLVSIGSFCYANESNGRDIISRNHEITVMALTEIVDELTKSNTGREEALAQKKDQPEESESEPLALESSSPHPSPSSSPSSYPSPSSHPSVKPSASPSASPSVKIQETATKRSVLPKPTAVDGVPYPVHILEPPSGKTKSAVIVLHGMGGNPDSVAQLTKLVQVAGFPETRFLIPRAENMFVTFLNKSTSAWFDILSNEENGPQDRSSLLRAARNINNLVLSQTSLGVTPDHVGIIGLSQGGALGLTVYLRAKVAGVASISSYLPVAETYPGEMTADSDSAPVLMVHGTEDNVIPVEYARKSAHILKAQGRMVSYFEIEGEGHDMSGALVQVVGIVVGLLNLALAPTSS